MEGGVVQQLLGGRRGSGQRRADTEKSEHPRMVGAPQGGWNDVACHVTMHFLCEFDKEHV